MAKLIVELELEMQVKDETTHSYQSIVSRFLRKVYNVPFGRVMENMRVTNVRKVEPWEESLPRF